MDKNPFLHRLMKEKKEDVVHSSAFSEAQNDGKIGSASTSSFSEKINIEQNRKVVKGYSDSKIVGETWGNKSKAKVYDKDQESRMEKRMNAQFAKDDNGGNGKVGLNRFDGRSTDSATTEKPATPPPARRNPGIFR